MADRWRGGQSGRIPLPDGSSDDDAAASYSFVQLADPQFGMLAALQAVQWQRPFVRAATCGRVKLPPTLEVAPDAVAGDSRFALGAAAVAAMEEELARRAVAAINALKPPPAFVVVCGDLVNAFPSAGVAGGGPAHAAQVREPTLILPVARLIGAL
jgi:hypothetical protein